MAHRRRPSRLPSILAARSPSPLRLLPPVPPPLALPLRAALRLQARPLAPAFREALSEATRLGLSPEERAAEAEVDAVRAALAASERRVAVQDFGAGTRRTLLSAGAKPAERAVAEIYRRAAATPAWGRFLFRLVRALRPRRLLELGTNLGVSASHLAAALALNGEGRLVSIEGDPALAEIARENLGRLRGGERALVLTGRFEERLPEVLPAHGPFDLVFLDGHHEREATLRYVERIRPHLAPGACLAFDDIEPWKDVRAAWRRIRAEHPEADAVDLGKMGLLRLP